MIYDGDCPFCIRWIERVRQWQKPGVLAYLPLQDDRAPEISGRSRDQLRHAIHLALPDGRVFHGARAVAELAPYLRGGGLLSAIFEIPGVLPVAERVYAWIARRRYGIGCSSDRCDGVADDP